MIQLQNIRFGYKKKQILFNDLTLDFEPGKIYGLLGKNGTGKTTLIKIMAGLLQPNLGICTSSGTDVFKRTPSTLDNIFVVPEEFSLPSITMKQYVNINAPFYSNFNLEQFDTYSREFELPNNKKLNTLSFGQKKKFLLSFGLATNARLMFLDEPTNGLDIPSKSQLRKIVAKALTEERSIVISTHQARDLESLIDTILIIEDGKIIFNHDYNAVSDQLSFEKTVALEDLDNVIYSEETLGGYKVVRKSEEDTGTLLDLELLFNAVIANKASINQHFKN